jgi:hypothetical protein
MKTKIFFFTFFAVLCAPVTIAQQTYSRTHGITGSDYSIKSELVLDYSYSVKDVQGPGNSQTGTLHFKSPAFLNFNKNDLLYFKAEPLEFIATPLLIDASCCFSGSEGSNEEVAGYTWINEHVTIIQDGESSEISLTGEQLSSVKIVFKMVDLENKVKNGQNNLQFRLEFYHDECSGCEQKNVSGFIKYGEMKITDNLRLDGRIVNSVRFNEYLNNALMENNMAGKDDKTKWAFEDSFTDNYFKDMPMIDANRLIDFLLNPKGVIEFPFSGFVNSPDGAEKMTFKGLLRLYGDKFYKFMISE